MKKVLLKEEFKKKDEWLNRCTKQTTLTSETNAKYVLTKKKNQGNKDICWHQ